MGEDRFGVAGRITRRKLRLAAKLNKRNRRLLTMAGIPLMAIAGVVPLIIHHESARLGGWNAVTHPVHGLGQVRQPRLPQLRLRQPRFPVLLADVGR